MSEESWLSDAHIKYLKGLSNQNQAMTDSYAGLCQPEITYSVSIVVLILPNLIALLISLITKTKTSKVLAVLNIVQNVLLAIAISHSICSKYLLLICYYLYGHMFIFTIIHLGVLSTLPSLHLGPLAKLNKYKEKKIIKMHEKMKKEGIKSPEEYSKKCCVCKFDCCISPEDVMAAQREMKMPRVSREELENAMRENEERPPTARVKSQGYYYTCCKWKRVIAEDYKLPINYQTWQEENEPVKMGTKPIQVYYCNVEYAFDEELKQEIEELKENAKQQLLKWEYESVEFIDPKFDGLVTEVLWAEDSCAEKCCRSCWCNCVGFTLAGLIGYTYLVTLWWRMQTDVIVFNSKKRMSSKRDLKANYNERLNENHDKEEMNEEIMEP